MWTWIKSLFAPKPVVVLEPPPAAQAPGAYVETFPTAQEFFADVRKSFGPLRQAQVEGFNQILETWKGFKLTNLEYLAYIFATTWHETAATMQPVVEYGGEKYLRSKKYWPFYGRGYVQLTWLANYIKYGIEKTPEKALDPAFAAHVLIHGMVNGVFTGKKLSDYFNARASDPVGARRIVNGTDKAQLIAGYYYKFLSALEADAPTLRPS